MHAVILNINIDRENQPGRDCPSMMSITGVSSYRFLKWGYFGLLCIISQFNSLYEAYKYNSVNNRYKLNVTKVNASV